MLKLFFVGLVLLFWFCSWQVLEFFGTKAIGYDDAERCAVIMMFTMASMWLYSKIKYHYEFSVVKDYVKACTQKNKTMQEKALWKIKKHNINILKYITIMQHKGFFK